MFIFKLFVLRKSYGRISQKNNAIGYEIITVGTKLQHQIAYRGEIIL